jgi:hypothetical protein
MTIPAPVANVGSAPSIKDLTEPGFFSVLFPPVPTMVRRTMFLFAWVSIRWGLVLRSGHCNCASGGALNQLVEFTPIKPHASALRAVVNFNALAFSHQKA